MIQAIIFDCFGVLTTDIWQEFLESLPIEKRAEASSLNRAFDSGYLELAEFMQAMRDLTGKHLFRVEDAVDSDVVKNVALLKYIRTLKQTYRIGLLSNIGTNWVREHFLAPAEQSLFDSMVFSFETGLAKPDAEIYQLASSKLQVLPENCIMVDDIERNCEGARLTGMQAIQYRSFTQMRAELEVLLSQSE